MNKLFFPSFLPSFLLLALTFFSCASSHDKVHQEGLNDKFTDPNMKVDKWVSGFENNDRDVFNHRKKIIKALKIKAGQCVADVGAGTGGFLPLLHKKVTASGKVYAVEISDNFLEYIQQRKKVEKLSSVEPIKGGYTSSNLPSQSCDIILLVDVYHHLDKPEQMLSDFNRVLRPQGLLAIVDFDRNGGKARPWILKHMKQSKEEVQEQVAQEGFTLYQDQPEIPFKENFMMIFQKK
jgi:ubiquinone/menaquinone biosynthesis C-methylase UbiE